MKLEFITVRDLNNGYGVTKDYFLRYFKEAGIELIDKLDYQEKQSDISLVYSYPTNIKWAHAKKKVIFTMFETDKIPEEWIPLLKKADLVINPTQWGAKVFAASGIKCRVVNLGINDEIFKYQIRPQQISKSREFIFLNYEAFTIRKGWHELFKAWQMAFKPDEPVKIIFKTIAKTYGMAIPNLKEYKNVEVINEAYTQKELLSLLRLADCFVYPSRGEGYGLPPLEAMATGIPVVAPNAHGISEYFNPDYMIDVKNEPIKAVYDHIKGDIGNFVKCDVEDLAKKLRYAYDNRDKYRERSKEISKYALNYTMKRSAEQLIRILKDL